jgi:hypothetical protein
MPLSLDSIASICIREFNVQIKWIIDALVSHRKTILIIIASQFFICSSRDLRQEYFHASPSWLNWRRLAGLGVQRIVTQSDPKNIPFTSFRYSRSTWSLNFQDTWTGNSQSVRGLSLSVLKTAEQYTSVRTSTSFSDLSLAEHLSHQYYTPHWARFIFLLAYFSDAHVEQLHFCIKDETWANFHVIFGRFERWNGRQTLRVRKQVHSRSAIHQALWRSRSTFWNFRMGYVGVICHIYFALKYE